MSKIINQAPGLFDDLKLPILMGTNPNDNALIFSVSPPLNSAQKKVKKEISKHMAAIEGINEKTELVINKREQLRNHGANVFALSISRTESLKALYEGSEYSFMFEQFLEASLQETGKNILGFQALAAALMSDQMQRDPDPPRKPLKEYFWD